MNQDNVNRSHQRFQFVGQGDLGVLDNLTRIQVEEHLEKQSGDDYPVLFIERNRVNASTPDPISLKVNEIRHGWVTVEKENFLKNKKQRLTLVRVGEVSENNARRSSIPSFLGSIRMDRIRNLLEQRDLLQLVAAGARIQVELVERKSKDKSDTGVEYPHDTIFFPTGRFADEQGQLLTDKNAQPET